MRPTLAAVGLIAVIFGLSISSARAQQASPCRPIDGGMRFTTMKIQLSLAHPAMRASWAEIGLSAADTIQVTPVEIDSLCRKAIQTINVYEKVSPSTQRSIYLVAIGGKAFWVADPQSHLGEFTGVWVLDSTLRVVRKRAMQ